MLNPIDTATVIGENEVSGAFPGQIHEGVAWWVGACYVALTRTSALAVADDGHPATAEFRRRITQGAVNARHFACHVTDLGPSSEEALKATMDDLGGVPGAYLHTSKDDDHTTITIRLYAADGSPVTETSGLADLRRMIDNDRIPIPVNEHARGTITRRFSDGTVS
ncbi:hypothetical protein ACFWFZ_23545 [Streptomyces sp. NPDC060232]|uniref:hypothetical protein n=1 Tax=Streptomyces sp. NPDC060232 TaxID=3347079 RepID=UPI003668B2BF